MLSHPKKIFLTFFLALLSLFCLFDLSAVQGQTSDASKIRSDFREMIKLFEQGQKAEAGRMMDDVLRRLVQSPNQELILELRNEAGFKFFLEAMSTKKTGSDKDKMAIRRLIKGAERFLKLAGIVEHQKRSNQKRILRLLQKMSTARHEERYYYMEVIANKIGQYVFTLPQIPNIIGKSSDNMQIPLIILLTRMGSHAVRPLIEILDSNDNVVRLNVASILGNIRDRRAIPALARLAEKDDDSSVQTAARKALEKIIGKITPHPAKEYYLALAEKFYANDPLYTRNPYREYVIWKWEKGKLKNWELPSLLFNEVLAEEALFDALQLDNSYDPAWTLLLNTYFAEINEVKASLQVAQDLDDHQKLSASGRTQKDLLDNAARALKMVNVVTSIRGKVQLYRALKRALSDRRAEVAVSCIETLRDLRVDGSLLPRTASVSSTPTSSNVRKVKSTSSPVHASSEGAPLVNALSSDDKRVRYAAAEALARLNPAQDFSGSAKVVSVLSEAISIMAPRTVLVMASSPQVRNAFTGNLMALNYLGFSVTSGKEGLHRALSVPTWDLIMISDYLPDLRRYEIIDRLKRDYRTKHIPIFILAKQRLMARAKSYYQGRADRVISMNSTQSSLRLELSDIFGKAEYKRDVKGRTMLMAEKAAEALASIPVRNTILQPQNALKALLGTMVKRNNGYTQPPEVQVPALKAIAHLQDPSALKDVTAVFHNTNNDENVRIAACYAMGEILKTMPDINQDAYKVLKVALQESSYKVVLAASRAFGKVPLRDEKYLELFNLRGENDGPYLFRHMVRLRRR